MDSSVSLKDQIWFLCVCHHIPFSLYYNRSPPTRTPRKPVLDWTDTPADINGLVRFAERPNLVSVRVPSHSVFTLPSTVCMVIIFTSWTFHYEGIFPIVSFFFVLSNIMLHGRDTVLWNACFSLEENFKSFSCGGRRLYYATNISRLRNRIIFSFQKETTNSVWQKTYD